MAHRLFRRRALYAERLALEVGLAENPYDELGILQSEIFRAVRLVVDTACTIKNGLVKSYGIYES